MPRIFQGVLPGVDPDQFFYYEPLFDPFATCSTANVLGDGTSVGVATSLGSVEGEARLVSFDTEEGRRLAPPGLIAEAARNPVDLTLIPDRTPKALLTRAELHAAFEEGIQTVAAENDEFFRLIVASARALGLRDELLSSTFGASVPTINRWCSGRAKPHPFARPKILQFIRENVPPPPPRPFWDRLLADDDASRLSLSD